MKGDLERRIIKIIAIGTPIGVKAALDILSPSASYAQSNPAELPSELRGFVNSKVSIDSVFAYNRKDNSLLDKTRITTADTVNAQGDTVTVPNFCRLVIPTDKASTPNTTEGATKGDILYFIALSDGTIYHLNPKNGVITHEPGIVKRADFDLGLPTSVENPSSPSIPEKFRLYQNYPNPFNPETIISYELNKKTLVSLAVYNILGQRVATLINKRNQPAGVYEVKWNGKNDQGIDVSSGVYIYRLWAPGVIKSKKMTLIR